MTAHPALISWPEDPSDAAGLALWTSEEIARATGGRASGTFAVSGVEIDSREVVDGDLFFALKGEASDGHRYLEGAFGRGAAGAVVEHGCFGSHVLVQNTSTALEDLGKAARNRVDAGIIGVTGSAGKTGVKEALYAALDRASRGRAHRSVKSYNNHVGVPLSLARMPARTSFGVFEMGMNHAGELAALTQLVRPHVAIVTTIAPAHIGHFSGEEAIADAKAEIFEGLEHGGVAIIPHDNGHYERLHAKAVQYAERVVSFGRHGDASVRLIDAVPASGGGTLVTADLGGRKVCYTISQPGEHWVTNSLAIMAAVEAIGGDLGAAGLALAEMEGLAGRGARHEIAATGGDDSGKALLIDESYNANPASMAVTLRQLGATPATRRVAILGAMRELGEAEARYHGELAGPISEGKVDRLVLVGAEMAPLADVLGKNGSSSLAGQIDVTHVQTASEAAECLAADGVRGGDAILVKGSNSVGLGAIVRSLTAKER
ncbi:UDP-N-acetylmuramoyl-tripeptide--D-alanyl-D-alanine ligase [Novosphingobium taihuense]|uniref:UDP-N-acetylmuramoyl-tripeptide--D-alanyl-D-alanine ligase n=1 Tax=Novosphingobium taihuense TaxID=260085 RepID=A0A7W7ADZ4_9SPHN|nr:UDP-N-acetylmuramoyl-tripeptide--D-alanyl-D-alanine ligase [Novosphingobium taihuense]MBB4615253.1 UDP-N-acetylmuramoyl-tripeptide--D-alanyl-D-alanine ligase [Novosphingobium taihuense]TWH84288.1 UDP-N-acetylmuramoyl-tripeptide--D-alanyl-D-alanine ligase [Novosphingobium taihuense]